MTARLVAAVCLLAVGGCGAEDSRLRDVDGTLTSYAGDLMFEIVRRAEIPPPRPLMSRGIPVGSGESTNMLKIHKMP